MFDIKNLKRYDFIPRVKGRGYRMVESNEGKMVKFEDIEKMSKPPHNTRFDKIMFTSGGYLE